MVDNELLQAIRQVVGEVVEEKLTPVNTRLDSMQSDIAAMQEDITQIKEDTAITRNQVTLLSDWAEQAQVEVRIPLYKKAE